jgi:group I intron endonuclease
MTKGPLLPGIYTITNTLTGRVYVGQTALTFRTRWSHHISDLNHGKHTSARLRRSWARDGESAFVFEVREVVPRPSGMTNADYRLLLCEREQHWTDALGAYGPNGFNVVPHAGSSLGHKHSPEVRANMSRGQRSRVPVTAETRAKMSAVMKGRIISREWREKIRAAQKGKPRSAKAQAATNAWNEAQRKRDYSPEERAKASKMLAPFRGLRKGTTATAETRAKLRAAWVRRSARNRSADAAVEGQGRLRL